MDRDARLVGPASTSAPAPHRGHAHTRLLAGDRAWARDWTAMAVGPLEVPPLEDLRRAARVIAERVPGAHVGDHLDVVGSRWCRLQPDVVAAARAAVTELEDPPGAVTDLLLQAAAVGDPLAAVRWVVAGDRLVIVLRHAVGDARTLMPLLAGLIQVARTGEVPQSLLEVATPAPLLRSLVHHHRQDVRGSVRRAVRVLGAGRAEPAGHATDLAVAPAGSLVRPVEPVEPVQPERDGAPAPARAGLPWQPQPAVVVATLDAAALRALKRWARQSAGVTSSAGLQVWLTRVVLACAGLEPVGRPSMLLDGRRSASPETVVPTNFVAPIELAVDDQWSGQSVAAALDAAVADARALTALAVGRIKQVVSRRDPEVGPVLVPSAPRPVVTVSCLSTGVFSAICTGEPSQRHLFGMTPVGRPDGMTASYLSDGRNLHVSFVFDEGVFPRGRLEAALAELAADPVALMSRGTGGVLSPSAAGSTGQA